MDNIYLKRFKKYKNYIIPVFIGFIFLFYFTMPTSSVQDLPILAQHISFILSSIVLALFFTVLIFGSLLINKYFGIAIIIVLGSFSIIQLSTYFILLSESIMINLANNYHIYNVELFQVFDGLMTFLGVLVSLLVPFSILFWNYSKDKKRKMDEDEFKYRILFKEKEFSNGTKNEVLIEINEKINENLKRARTLWKNSFTISNVSDFNVFVDLSKINFDCDDNFKCVLKQSSLNERILLKYDNIIININIFSYLNEEKNAEINLKIPVKNAIGIKKILILTFNPFISSNMQISVK